MKSISTDTADGCSDERNINGSSNNPRHIHSGLVARKLECEFRRVLEPAVTRTEFVNEIGKLLQLIGFTGFIFLHCKGINSDRIGKPKILISNCLQDRIDAAINSLCDPETQKINTHLQKIYYQATDSSLGSLSPNTLDLSNRSQSSSRTSVNPGYSALLGREGNVGYVFNRTSLCLDGQIGLCIMADHITVENFRRHIENNLFVINIISQVVENLGMERFSNIFTDRKHQKKTTISSKPLRLLNMIAREDLTVSQAAKILNISVDTANKHIAKIKSDLGVTTLHSAVLRAIDNGLIVRD